MRVVSVSDSLMVPSATSAYETFALELQPVSVPGPGVFMALESAVDTKIRTGSFGSG